MPLAYAEYLLNEEKTPSRNLHIEHLEDEVFNGGVVGARGAINFLQSLRDMLAGHSATSKTKITTKWDGAPSIFAGINPDNGRFFVGTKSIFNANAKLNYTDADIDANHPGEGLNKTLKLALKYFPELGIHGVLQGDVLFTEDELKWQKVDGQEMITFQPNTIMYAVPANSKLGHRMAQAKIGIIWHTTYKGKSLNAMDASYSVDIGYLRNSKNVWYRDATFTDASGAASLTEAETASLTAKLSQAGSIFRQIPAAVLNKIATNDYYHSELRKWNNLKVREGQMITSTVTHTSGFIHHVEQKLNKSILEAKKQDTKFRRVNEKKVVMDFLLSNKDALKLIFDLWNTISEAKLMIIRKLEQVKEIGTFKNDENGFTVTAPEGFVAVDTINNKAVKLVDRLTFSKNNFDTQKAWNK